MKNVLLPQDSSFLVPPKVSFVERYFLWCPLFGLSINRDSTVLLNCVWYFVYVVFYPADDNYSLYVDLSLYELHRKPQELVTDSTTLVVGQHTLAAELKCPICLDILQNTMTTKDCIHRFCQECITTALRNG